MSDCLANFVNALDQDPILMQEYSEKPQQTSERYGVAPEDLALLFANDAEGLKQRLNMTGFKAVLWISHCH
jgi:hypothetical protein